jgi:hypothetical protein
MSFTKKLTPRILAAKRVAPKIPLGVLLLGAYAIDIVWGVFFS